MGAMAGLAAMYIGGQILSNITAPDGQQLESFDGQPDINANAMMQEILPMLRDQYKRGVDRAKAPVNLPSSYVQGLPTFSGGGMPMPIGVTGRDYAGQRQQAVGGAWNLMGDANQLHKEFKLPDEIPQDFPSSYDEEGGWQYPNSGSPIPHPVDLISPQPEADNAVHSQHDVSNGPRATVARRQRPGTDLIGGDDSEQALAAVHLLMGGR
jgi:hypothetical protein